MCAVENGISLCTLGSGRILSPIGLIFSVVAAILGILSPVLEHGYFLVSGRMEFPFLVLPISVDPSWSQRSGSTEIFLPPS